MDLEFAILTVCILVGVYMLIQWRDTSAQMAPRYSVVKARSYSHVNDDVQGYSAARQGAAFSARVPGEFENFSSDEAQRRRDMDLVPIAPLGIISPAESLARLQAQEAENELRELQDIREKQQAASVSLLPDELDESVVALVDRNLLLNSGPVAATDTRGSSLRNGSLDLRREIPIQREPISIWNIGTYDSQGYRRPLE